MKVFLPFHSRRRRRHTSSGPDAQIVEVVWQLRNQAGKRQVKDPKVGLTHCVGGATPGIGQRACSVHILKR